MAERDKINYAIEPNSAWGLTNEWMKKVEKAYDDYMTGHFRVVWTLPLVVLAWFLIMAGMFVLETAKRNIFSVTTEYQEWAFIFMDIISICVAILLGIYLLRRIQQQRILKNELADLFAISHELFQMVVAGEEHNSGNRYEYLVNHVRILEIKHLLKKVEKVVGSQHSKIE